MVSLCANFPDNYLGKQFSIMMFTLCFMEPLPPPPSPSPPRHVIGHAQSVYIPFFNCFNRYRPQRYISSIFRRAWRIQWV